MKKTILSNVVKGWVSTLIGLALICASSYMSVFNGTPWVWEGLTGCGVGAVLFFTPDSIKDILSAVIKKKTE